MRVLRRTWSLDAGGRLRLQQRFEGIGVKMREVQTVYDRE